MKKFVLLAVAIFLVLEYQTDARSQTPYIQKPKARRNVDHPEVPRVSAYEAYVKYKAGKALIIHAGGNSFKNRHIVGAFDVPLLLVAKGKISLPKLPRRGIEIFTYCYWGPGETDGAGLASYMIKKKGYRNVKTVRGGGRALEKYFDRYQVTFSGGKIISPRTGKVIKLKR